MLKHASGGLGAIPVNGQIRGNISANGPRSIHLRPQQPLNVNSLNGQNNGHLHTATGTTTTTTSPVLNTNIQLHGNLNGNGNGKGNSQIHRNTNGHNNINGNSISSNGGGGGQRSPKTVVTSVSSHTTQTVTHSHAQGQTPTTTIPVGEQSTAATMVTAITASTASVTPPNPVLNGAIGNNLHTYTNQHIALANAIPENAIKVNSHGNNASYYHHLQHQHQQQQQQQQQQANHNILHHNYTTSVNSPPANHHHHHNHNHLQHYSNHQHSNIPPPRQPPPLPPAVTFGNTTLPQSPHYASGVLLNQSKHGPGPREALTSLGLLCLLSLLLALLSLIFLLKISPNSREDAHSRSATEDFIIVYDVTLALCALSLSLNLCCLLVCAIQFLFAVKLVRSPLFDGRDNRYLEKSSTSRICAVGGFFISIPIFLTGIILYTFNHFHSTPAIITSVLIGFGIIFCGGAMVHNVFLWQKEKTISYRTPPLLSNTVMRSSPGNASCLSNVGGGTRNGITGLHYLPPPPMTTSTSMPVHLMANASSICPVTPPAQFLNHQGLASHHHISFNHHHPTNTSLILQPTTVTPVSPNHSHTSFNPLTTLSSTFLMRPSTTTPPTPKSPLMANGCLASLNGMQITTGETGGTGREASGSISPALPPISNNLDLSVLTNVSLHELSTLV